MNEMLNVYAGEALAKYGFPGGHPFSTLRFDVFWQEFITRKLQDNVCVRVCPPKLANVESIELFHTRLYIDQVQKQSETGMGYLDGGDTPAFPGVYDAAAYVVGTVLEAVNDIMLSNCRYAFVPIAGLHHAHRDQASGFCVFNDCGIAIECLLRNHNLTRVAYIDIDAHHGDGVYYAFESDPHLIFADLHEDGRYLFPGTGAVNEVGKGQGLGLKLNVPMPKFAGDKLFFEKFDIAMAFVTEKKPDFIILQCGVDSMAGDPITHLQYTSKAHQYAAVRLRKLAVSLGHGRLLCLGGGGYSLENIANGWCAVVEGLLNE